MRLPAPFVIACCTSATSVSSEPADGGSNTVVSAPSSRVTATLSLKYPGMSSFMKPATNTTCIAESSGTSWPVRIHSGPEFITVGGALVAQALETSSRTRRLRMVLWLPSEQALICAITAKAR